ncbi:amidohydrolase, partial [Streptomyces sp. NPDC058953]
ALSVWAIVRPRPPLYARGGPARARVARPPHDRVARWSTDPRSGTPGLPDLTPGGELPLCLRTVVSGQIIFDRLNG